MGLVGKPAPLFKAGAVINGGEIVSDFSLEQYKGKKVVLFFYPLDFTFVCPTELLAFQEKLAEFEKRKIIDYIFLKRIKIVNKYAVLSEMLNDIFLSDHCPVFAQIEL